MHVEAENLPLISSDPPAPYSHPLSCQQLHKTRIADTTPTGMKAVLSLHSCVTPCLHCLFHNNIFGIFFSHLLLIVNSSTNMILYIFLNKNFRAHFISMVRSTSKFLCRMYPFRRVSMILSRKKYEYLCKQSVCLQFRNNNTNETPDFEIHSLNGGHKEANGTNNALDENKDGIGHSPGCNGETAITMVSPQTPHQNNLVAPAPPPPPPGSGSGAGGAAASSPTGNGNNEAAKKSNQLTVPGAKSPIKEPAAAAQQWTTPVKSDSTASATPDSGQKPTPV